MGIIDLSEAKRVLFADRFVQLQERPSASSAAIETCNFF